MSRARHVPVIDLEYRRAVKAGAAIAADWREMMAWASGGSPTGAYEWARWLDMASAALAQWVNAWQASIDAGRAPPPETLAKLEAHRDGLRALRAQLYLLSIANAREQLQQLPKVAAAAPSIMQPPRPVAPAAQQGSLL